MLTQGSEARGTSPGRLRFQGVWSIQREMGGKVEDLEKSPVRVLASADVPEEALACVEGRVIRVEEAGSCDLRIVGPRELEREGLRALRRHRLRWPQKPVLVLYAPTTSAAEVRDCFRAGAVDALSSEAPAEELERTLADLILRQQVGWEREEEARLLAAELGNHARDLETALERLSESYDQTLNALVAALDIRERETAFHSQRVALYSVLVGMRMGVAGTALENLYRGALLHDIGKIGTPDAVLLKPGSFTEEEWVIMRQHAEVGGQILDGVAFLSDAADVPRSHHEAWDGSGYPSGLAGTDIPLNARIFAVVDSYDAIRSKRPYKEAQPHDRAVALLKRAAGQRLDPTIVDRFVQEPEATWSQLEASLAGGITFDTSIASCRAVSTRAPVGEGCA